MIGVLAQFTHYSNNKDISLNDKELEEARWFSRSDVFDMLARSTGPDVWTATSEIERLPPPFTIAHQLIRFWAEEQTQQKL